MKKITINNALSVTDTGENEEDKHLSQFEIEGPEEMDASDGYHTFTELYEHRIALFIALCKLHKIRGIYDEDSDSRVWRSRLHSDGSSFDGWFILGISEEKGEQITYHLPNSSWEATEFAETLEKAPEYDGHTSGDVITRLKNL